MPISGTGPTFSGMGPIPDRPLASDCQNPSWSSPRALITPIPDMTTRIYTVFKKDCAGPRVTNSSVSPIAASLLGCSLGRGVLLGIHQVGDTVDHFADGLDLLRVFVFDLDVELTFEIEEDIDAVHRIDAQLLEGAVGLNFLQRNPLGSSNHSKNTCLDRLRHKGLRRTTVLPPRTRLQGRGQTVSVTLNREPSAGNSLSLNANFSNLCHSGDL